MEEMDYFTELKASLEEALAFERGDASKCKVSVRELSAPLRKADDALLKQGVRVSE